MYDYLNVQHDLPTKILNKENENKFEYSPKHT